MICGYRYKTKNNPILLFIKYRNWYILSIRLSIPTWAKVKFYCYFSGLPYHNHRPTLKGLICYSNFNISSIFSQAQSDDDDNDDVAVTVDSSGFMEEFFEQVKK